MTTRQIREGDNGNRFDFQSGETFYLRLNENLTTGFRWKERFVESEAITLISTDIEKIHPESPGSGGVRVYRFRAMKPGVAKIHLVQERIHDRKIRKTFAVTIHVTD